MSSFRGHLIVSPHRIIDCYTVYSNVVSSHIALSEYMSNRYSLKSVHTSIASNKGIQEDEDNIAVRNQLD